MELREEIREMVVEELKSYIKEELTRKDFVELAQLIRQTPDQYHQILTNFTVEFARRQNPRFDEARFREAVKSGKGI